MMHGVVQYEMERRVGEGRWCTVYGVYGFKLF